MRTKAIVVSLLLGIVIGSIQAWAQFKPRATNDTPEAINIIARPVSGFDKSDPAIKKFGALQFNGGLVLSSPSNLFGGWSGLYLDNNGRKLIAVSDAGTWMTAAIDYSDGQPRSVSNARISALRALSGDRLTRKRDVDAEGMTLAGGNLISGTAYIAFEQNDRIGEFPIRKGELQKPKRYLRIPDAVRLNRRINGLESVSIMRAGKYRGGLVAFMEAQLTADGYHSGWMLLPTGKSHPIFVKDIDGFALTDAASLDNGGLIILERRFRWSEGVKMRIRYLEPGSIKPGAKMTGEVLISATMQQQIDNMEGLAVHYNAAGDVILTVISDDNFNSIFQRTLLLQFTWSDTRVRRNPAANLDKRREANKKSDAGQ